MHGSFQPFTKPRDEATMKRNARASGRFPRVGKSHEKMLEAQLEKIQSAREVSAIQARRQAEDARINNQIETERLQSLLGTQRMPGLRGQMGRMRNSQRVAEQVNATYA